MSMSIHSHSSTPPLPLTNDPHPFSPLHVCPFIHSLTFVKIYARFIKKGETICKFVRARAKQLVPLVNTARVISSKNFLRALCAEGCITNLPLFCCHR